MGTRGACGVRIDGTDKISYSNWDSYPAGLGDDTVADLRALLVKMGLDGVRQLARELRLVDEKDGPEFRGLEGVLRDGVIGDCATFPTDSLFCEYAYVVNLDAEVLEVYFGGQRSAHTAGRYASIPRIEGRDYFPVALVAAIPFHVLVEHPERKLATYLPAGEG